MVSTRLLATWLFVVGIAWLLIAVWVMLVMSGISTPAVAVWSLFVLYYASPFALITGATLVFARRYSRVGLVLALLACAWLTWIIGSDLWPREPENDAIAPMHYDWLSVTLALIVILTDAAVIAMWRAPEPSNQSMQPTAGRSDA
jgi:hypothetical protein